MFSVRALAAIAAFAIPIVWATTTSTITVTQTDDSCPARSAPASSLQGVPQSPRVIYYSTTNAQGQTVLASSTTYAPENALVVGYTTTNSAGMTVVSSSTTYPPITNTQSGYVVQYTTTSGASTITTSSTYYPSSPPSSSTPATTGSAMPVAYSPTTSTATTTSAIPAAVASAPCPTDLGSNYVDALGKKYQLFCNVDFLYVSRSSAMPPRFITSPTTSSSHYIRTHYAFADYPL